MVINNNNNKFYGIGAAILATLIWSGNFIVARGVIHEIPPVSLAFYRWMTATILLAPFAIRSLKAELPVIKKNWKYLLIISFFGITAYNTLIYIAGTYIPAMNLALIGTTSSPVMSILLAAIFLKEAIKPLRIIGLISCITGILILLSKGSWDRLIHFHFTAGDWWILLAALCFAIYNIMARKRPSGITPVSFLFITFLIGTTLLFPAFLVENNTSHTPINWNWSLVLIIAYLGIGNSIISFLCWNIAISRLGAARTALFGNLIPIFSSFEAVILLGEKITSIHIISGLLVIGGLLLANLSSKPKT